VWHVYKPFCTETFICRYIHCSEYFPANDHCGARQNLCVKTSNGETKMSNFDKVLVNNNGNGDDKVNKEKVYMKAKKDFPINKPVPVHIIDAHPSRQFFRAGTPECLSFDGEIGRTKDSQYKDEYDCKECRFYKGITTEEGNQLKCQYKLTLIIENEDPEKENILKISYGAQINMSEYIQDLKSKGLDVPDVITYMTRIEREDGPGTTYTFEMGEVRNIEMTDDEKDAVGKLQERIKEDGKSMDIEMAANILTKMKSVQGISEERAKMLIETIAVSGYVEA